MSCGVGHSRGSDLALLWLWRRLVAIALIQPLTWEPPCVAGAALKRPKKKKKKKIRLWISASVPSHSRDPLQNSLSFYPLVVCPSTAWTSTQTRVLSAEMLVLHFLFFPFFWPHPRHMEVPGPELKPTPQVYWEPQQWWHWIHNPLNHKGRPSSSFQGHLTCEFHKGNYACSAGWRSPEAPSSAWTWQVFMTKDGLPALPGL